MSGLNAARGLQQRARGSWRNVLGTIAVVVVLAAAAVWLLHRNRYPEWEERVQLPDGREVVVHERREYRNAMGTMQTWLTFTLPEIGGPITWNERMYPVMLGVDAGTVYIVGRPVDLREFRFYRFPRFVYVAFRYDGERFVRIPFLSVPPALRQRENVRWCFPGGTDRRELTPRAYGGWCEEVDPEWPRPRTVDLALREREAAGWARAGGATRFSE